MRYEVWGVTTLTTQVVDTVLSAVQHRPTLCHDMTGIDILAVVDFVPHVAVADQSVNVLHGGIEKILMCKDAICFVN